MATPFKQTVPDTARIDPAALPEHYAAVGKGKCMEPIIHDGACLVFASRGEPQAGDLVGLWFKAEHVAAESPQQWFKRLVVGPPTGWRFGLQHPRTEVDPIVVVEQFNPPRRYSIPASHILALHRCLGEAELGPNGTARIPRSLLQEAC